MARSLVSKILGILVLASGLTAQSPTWEPIAADYRNVRGMDFIMTFQDPETFLGIAQPPDYTDVASGAAMWMCYDPTDVVRRQSVDDQLDRIKATGFNTIRVWLSWQVYESAPAMMASRFQYFLNRCNMKGLHVIPVLWDNDFHEPDASSIAGANNGNYHRWIRSPGQAVVLGATGTNDKGRLGPVHEQFIVDMMMAAAGSMNPQIVLLWDVMNEPEIESDITALGQGSWIMDTLEKIKATDPNAKTCVTPASWKPMNLGQVAIAASDLLDVMSFNFYGYGKRDIEGLCDNIRQVCVLAGCSATKPILVAEAGRIGEGMYYPEVMNLVTKVPSQFTGNANGPGVGFCLFSANVGQAWAAPIYVGTVLTNVNFPVWEMGDGLFYSPNYDLLNGTVLTRFVRDYYPNGPNGTGPLVTQTIQDIAALAALHGYPVPATTTLYLQQPFLTNGLPNPNYIRQWDQKLPDGTSRGALASILNAAGTNATTCGFYRGQWIEVERELRIGAWIYAWSFLPDWLVYNLPTNLVTQAHMLAMPGMLQKINEIHSSNPSGWFNDPNMQSIYQDLFTLVHTYWLAGGYDSRY